MVLDTLTKHPTLNNLLKPIKIHMLFKHFPKYLHQRQTH